jgi:hypothetical protein
MTYSSTVAVASRPRIRCREIGSADVKGIVNLLTRGFPSTHDHWVSVFNRLSEHPTPPGFPKYGYLLECDGIPVGASLLIFSSITSDGRPSIRCNVCCWYVEPAFRSYAPMLGFRERLAPRVTFFNVTPAPHTLPMLEKRGYKRYSSGCFVAIPALSTRSCGASVTRITEDICPGDDLPDYEIDLLSTHASYGCISLICRLAGKRYPFVFAPRRMRPKFGALSFLHLVYCRGPNDFVRFAGALGRSLLRRGFPLVVLDSNGPIHGLIGAYFKKQPKYYKGPETPRLGDLTYSELSMFGVADWIWRDWPFIRAEISQSIRSYLPSIMSRKS